MGIRLELFFLAEGPGENVIPVTLENEEFLGNYCILYVTAGQSELVCRVDVPEYELKQQVYIKFEMENIYFFDKETTQLVLYAKVGEEDE